MSFPALQRFAPCGISGVPEPDNYRLDVARSAARTLAEDLPEAVAVAVNEFLTGDLLVAPRRVGHELRNELARAWSARRGTYRIIYEINEIDEIDEIDEIERSILVLKIQHRRDAYHR